MDDSGNATAERTAPDAAGGPSPAVADSSSDGLGWLLCALVLGLARFHRLGDWSLWYDEVVTVADGWHSIGAGRNYNPIGYLLIRWTVALSGGVPDELALRLLPAILGWLAIPLTYWAFHPFCGGRRAGVAALLVALSSWQLYWSQNARFYTMAEVVGLVGAGLCLRGYLGRRAWLAPAGVAVVALGTTMHLQAAVLCAALAAAPWGLRLAKLPLEDTGRRAALWVALLVVAGVTAGSPWILDVWERYQGNKVIVSPVQSLRHFVLATGFFVTPALGAAFLVGAGGALRERDRFFVLCSLVVVLGVGAVAVAGVLAQVTAQYVFVFGPFIAIVAVWPLDRIAERFGGHLAATGYAALLVLPLASESVLYFLVRHGERPRWREAYSYVANNRGADDVIIGMQASVGEYYLAPGTTDLRNPTVVAWNDRHNADTYAVWALRERPMWLVMRPDFFGKWPREERRNLEAFLREECRLARRFPVEMEGRDLDVEVWFRP